MFESDPVCCARHGSPGSGDLADRAAEGLGRTFVWKADHAAGLMLWRVTSWAAAMSLIGAPLLVTAHWLQTGVPTHPNFYVVPMIYWLMLFVGWVSARGRNRLALCFFVAHTVMAGAVYAWAWVAGDSVAQYWIVMQIPLADLPLLPIYVIRYKFSWILPVSIFASLYWAAVGWLAARSSKGVQKTTHLPLSK